MAVTFIQRVTFSTGRGKLPGGGGDQVVPGLTPDGQTKRVGVPCMGRTWQRPSAWVGSLSLKNLEQLSRGLEIQYLDAWVPFLTCFGTPDKTSFSLSLSLLQFSFRKMGPGSVIPPRIPYKLGEATEWTMSDSLLEPISGDYRLLFFLVGQSSPSPWGQPLGGGRQKASWRHIVNKPIADIKRRVLLVIVLFQDVRLAQGPPGFWFFADSLFPCGLSNH